MADSVSTEAWLDQRRWVALEEALKAQGSDVKRHLQDYLITLYNETVPLERWTQIETAITKEEPESAQEAEDQKVYAAFHIRENGHDSIFSTGNGEEFLDVAIRLRRYLQGGTEAVKGDFSHHFYKTQPTTRERFDELAALRLENTGNVTGAFEIDLDAGWCSALNLADGWQTFKNKDVSTAAYHANRTRNIQRDEQWRRLVDYLYGRDIELQTFGPVETRGIRPLREGDLAFPEAIILSGHGLNFQFGFISDKARREVLGPAVDYLEPGSWLDILCNYDAARQEVDTTLSLTLYRQDGAVQKLFTFAFSAGEPRGRKQCGIKSGGRKASPARLTPPRNAGRETVLRGSLFGGWGHAGDHHGWNCPSLRRLSGIKTGIWTEKEAQKQSMGGIQL